MRAATEILVYEHDMYMNTHINCTLHVLTRHLYVKVNSDVVVPLRFERHIAVLTVEVERIRITALRTAGRRSVW